MGTMYELTAQYMALLAMADDEEIEPANEQDVHVSLSLANIVAHAFGDSDLAIVHQDDN